MTSMSFPHFYMFDLHFLLGNNNNNNNNNNNVTFSTVTLFVYSPPF